MEVIVPIFFEEKVDVILDEFKKNIAMEWDCINPDTGKNMLQDFELIYPICVKNFKKLFIPVKSPKDTTIDCDSKFKSLVIPDDLLERSEIIFNDVFVGVQENYDDLELAINKIERLFK